MECRTGQKWFGSAFFLFVTIEFSRSVKSIVGRDFLRKESAGKESSTDKIIVWKKKPGCDIVMREGKIGGQEWQQRNIMQ